MTRRAVFLDRDGTVVEERHYLADPADVSLVPGAVEALRLLRQAGFKIVLVTNQSGIAKGLYTFEQYEAVAARLNGMLTAAGVLPDDTRFCPHHPDFTGPCACRKPGSGMHRTAARLLDVDLAASFYVGDKVTDVAVARDVGGTGVLVRTGYGTTAESDVDRDVHVVDDLLGAARLITELR